MFAGSIVAAITPMREDGAIDLDAWARLVEFHAVNGTTGLVVGGTTGESATISDDELDLLVARAIEVAARRLQVIAGAGSSSTRDTVERVARLARFPLDGVLVVTPAYNRPTQEGLHEHYVAVAQASTVPVILYNVPTRTAVDLLPATVARLAAVPRIVAVKEAVASLERIRELVRIAPGGFTVLSGDDATAREAMTLGAAGVISVTGNVAPRLLADMVAAVRSGELRRAAELDARLAGLHEALFVESNPIPAKWAVARLGLCGGAIRLPLTRLAAELEPAVGRAMVMAGIRH
jgi:4-hydroxy-tetrahydrodipicolinate synthase